VLTDAADNISLGHFSLLVLRCLCKQLLRVEGDDKDSCFPRTTQTPDPGEFWQAFRDATVGYVPDITGWFELADPSPEFPSVADVLFVHVYGLLMRTLPTPAAPTKLKRVWRMMRGWYVDSCVACSSNATCIDCCAILRTQCKLCGLFDMAERDGNCLRPVQHQVGSAVPDSMQTNKDRKARSLLYDRHYALMRSAHAAWLLTRDVRVFEVLDDAAAKLSLVEFCRLLCETVGAIQTPSNRVGWKRALSLVRTASNKPNQSALASTVRAFDAACLHPHAVAARAALCPQLANSTNEAVLCARASMLLMRRLG
jgi:hypothetical protein